MMMITWLKMTAIALAALAVVLTMLFLPPRVGGKDDDE